MRGIGIISEPMVSGGRVLLRADAGSRIGFGHFVRTTALAAYLHNDFTCMVASFNPDGQISDYQKNLVTESGAKLLPLNAATVEKADSIFLNSVSENDIVVLDNYYFSTQYQSAVRAKAKALICIDDVHDRHFVADAVMTFCPLTRADFSLEPYTRFYGGMEWSFLRAPFLRPRITRKVWRKNPRVVMAMGGADPFRLTDKMIEIVTGVLPEASLDVIAGQTVEVKIPESENVRIWRQLNAVELADLFDAADWGLFPASTVCVEAFSRGLPVAAGYYVGNQEEIYAFGVQKDWFAPLGCLLDSPVLIADRLTDALHTSALQRAPDFDFSGHKTDIINIFKSIKKQRL